MSIQQKMDDAFSFETNNARLFASLRNCTEYGLNVAAVKVLESAE